MKQIGTLSLPVRKLLMYTPLQYMLDAFHENPKLGKLFVDDEEIPSSCIFTLKHWVFLGGNLSQDCLRYLVDDILNHDIQNRQHVFFVIYPEEFWEHALLALFPDKSYKYERSLYISTPECIDMEPKRDEIFEITADLLKSSVTNLDMIVDEVISTGTYNNIEDYLNRGIGYTPIIDNKVCGFCTSEYPSKKTIAIGIEVLEEHQKKGYAKIMTKAFQYKSFQRGLTIYWECWKNNIASVNTALSCEFEKVEDYPILFLKF